MPVEVTSNINQHGNSDSLRNSVLYESFFVCAIVAASHGSGGARFATVAPGQFGGKYTFTNASSTAKVANREQN